MYSTVIALLLTGKPDVLRKILTQAQRPLADAAAVNATRWTLYNELKLTGLPVDGKCLDGVQPVVETGSGGQTKYNRYRLNLPKTHWLDAAFVGVLDQLYVENHQPLLISAKGHGTRQICRTNKYGFPIRHCSRTKIHKGFQTGDIVKAIVKSHQRQENRNLYRTSCYSKNWVI